MAKIVGDFCILQRKAELAGSKKHMAIEGNFMALCNKDLQSILSEERYDNDVPGCAMCFCIFACAFCCNRLAFVDFFFRTS